MLDSGLAVKGPREDAHLNRPGDGKDTCLRNHSLIRTLVGLTGNPRGCVYTEPLWGIPFNLYTPYVSVFMVALGLTDSDIGFIVSIGWGSQLVWALLSGVITDKLGRRLTTLVFDILAWGVPSLISALAQNFWWFLVAIIINGVWRVTHNSWTCLLVEEADPDQLVDIYTWVYISNTMVGLVAPLAGLMIAQYTLVPTMRGLYLFAAVMFTVKAFVTYAATRETRQGEIRMRETRHQSVVHILGGYLGVVRDVLRSPRTLSTAGIMLVLSIGWMISGNFWAILATEKLHIADQDLATFPFVKSAVMILFFFTVMPWVNRLPFRIPMVVGFVGYVVSQVLLITAPDRGFAQLALSVALEACSFAVVSPLVDKLVVLTIDAQERARVQSILSFTVITLTAPFGWIAGALSTLNKDLPFMLSIALFLAGAGLALLAGYLADRHMLVEASQI